MSDAGPAPESRHEHSIGRFLLVGGAGVLLVQMLGMLSGTASQLLLARLLSPEALAAYFLTVSVVEVAAHLGHVGLPRLVTRRLAEAAGTGRSQDVRGVLRSAAPLSLLAASGIALVYSSGLGEWLAREVFHSEIMASATAVAAVWIVARAFSDLAAAALRGLRRVGLAALFGTQLPRIVLACTLAALFVAVGREDFVPVVAIAAAAAWLGASLALVSLRTSLAGFPAARRTPVASLLRSAWPLLLAGLVNVSYTRTDLWAVAGLLGGGEPVALYGAAKRLIVLVSLPLVILNLVVPPVVAELHARQDLARLQRAVRGAATLAGLPAALVLAVLGFGSDQVLGLAFGEFYRGGAGVLAILSLERFVFVWVGPCGMVLAMTGHERTLMKITLLAAALTVAGVFAGAHWAGLLGVAAGFAAASIVQQLLTWYAVRRIVGMRTDVDLLHLGDALKAARRALKR